MEHAFESILTLVVKRTWVCNVCCERDPFSCTLLTARIFRSRTSLSSLTTSSSSPLPPLPPRVLWIRQRGTYWNRKPIRANKKPGGMPLRSLLCSMQTAQPGASARSTSRSERAVGSLNDVCALEDIASSSSHCSRVWRAQCQSRERAFAARCCCEAPDTVTGSPARRAEIHCITLLPTCISYLIYAAKVHLLCSVRWIASISVRVCLLCVRCRGGAENSVAHTRRSQWESFGHSAEQSWTIDSFVMGNELLY